MKHVMVIALILMAFSSPLRAAENRADDYLKEGTRWLDSGKYQKAIKAFERAAQLNQQSAEAFKGLGLAYFRLGHNEVASDIEIIGKAKNALLQAVNIHEDPEAYYNLGLICLALHEKDTAVTIQKYLQDRDRERAEDLAVRISAYVPLKTYRQIPNPEADRLEAIAVERAQTETQKNKATTIQNVGTDFKNRAAHNLSNTGARFSYPYLK